jgi:hypothetical protein
MRLFYALVLLFPFWALTQNDAFISGGNNDDIGYSFTPNGIGGYVLLSTERTAIDSSEQISLINIDSKGNTIWHRTYGHVHQDIPEHIEQANDGGYIISGSKWDGGYTALDGYVIKINAEGLIQWQKYLGGHGREEFFSGIPTSDGGFIFCGFANSDAPLSFGKMFVVKTNTYGTEEWRTYIGGTGKDYAFDVIETSDNHYIITGVYSGFHRYSTFEFTEPDSDILVSKLDANGNEIWTNQYGGTDNDIAYQCKESPDGNLLIIGSTQSEGAGSFDINLRKIDPNGIEVSSQTFGDFGFDYGTSLDISEDNYLYITGSTNTDTINHTTDIIVLKTDLAGNVIWEITFGGTESDYGNEIRATQDGGCAVIGSTRNNGDDNICFLKLSAAGTIEPLLGSNENNLLVFPNPGVDNINFLVQENENCFTYEYEIFDYQGKIVYSFSKSSKLVSVDLSLFAQGTYNYRITSPCAGEFRGKFIVH